MFSAGPLGGMRAPSERSLLQARPMVGAHAAYPVIAPTASGSGGGGPPSAAPSTSRPPHAVASNQDAGTGGSGWQYQPPTPMGAWPSAYQYSHNGSPPSAAAAPSPDGGQPGSSSSSSSAPSSSRSGAPTSGDAPGDVPWREMFDTSHAGGWHPLLLALYFPLGAALSVTRMAAWVALLLMDARALTDDDAAIATLQALLGISVMWHHAERLPPAGQRAVLVSNHVTPADVMALYRLPRRTTHLIHAAIPERATQVGVGVGVEGGRGWGS